MIIDFHTHIFPPWMIARREEVISLDPLFAELYSSPKARLITAEDLIEAMDREEITASVVLNIDWSLPELCHETNEYIMESMARYPGRLIGFGMVKLDRPETSIKEIEIGLKSGMKGIGEIRPTRELLRNTILLEPVFRKIIDSNLILLTHASEPVGHMYPGKGEVTPEVIYSLVTAFPELKLVCAHWGGGLPFYMLMPEVKKALENVYFDSAASPFLYTPQVYSQAARLAGAGKILFGTDFPLLSPKRLLNEIRQPDLSESDIDLILSGNAVKLLGINKGMKK